MGREKEGRITECEEIVMAAVWKLGVPQDLMTIVNYVNEEFGETWKPQTVSTFLSRLKKKGYLDAYDKGRYRYYFSTITKDEYVQKKIRVLTDLFFDGDMEMMQKQIGEIL